MSICFFLLQNYPKSVEKATESLEMKLSIKGFYRRGKGYVLLKNYDKAIHDFEEAIKLDTTDPNDIQQELMQVKAHKKALDKKSDQKYKGFLLTDDLL